MSISILGGMSLGKDIGKFHLSTQNLVWRQLYSKFCSVESLMPHLINTSELDKAGPIFLATESSNTWLNKGKATPQKADVHVHILVERC